VAGDISRTRPDRPGDTPSLIYDGYRVIPAGNAAGPWLYPPTPSSVDVKEIIELYIFSRFGPSLYLTLMNIYVFIKLFLYFFWVIPQRLDVMYRRFGTPYSIFLYGAILPNMKMEHTEGSETPANKIQTPGNHPKDRIQHSEHGESLKSGKVVVLCELRIAISYIIIV
jgi:hypothetical protein